MELIALASLLGLSLAANLGLVLHVRSLKTNLQRTRKAPAPTLEAEQLLHDLTRGGSVVRVIPLNPEELFLRSPR